VEWLNQVDLAFRTDLREVNEANFRRLDAKLEQRSAELRSDLRGEIATLRGEMGTLRAEFATLRGEMVRRSEMDTFRAEVRAELQGMKAELIKWMFLFWAGSAFAGLLLK
jgi:hypothetical protein